jgi:hypothetical protein
VVLGHLGMIRFMASDPGPPPKHWSAAEWDVLRVLAVNETSCSRMPR